MKMSWLPFGHLGFNLHPEKLVTVPKQTVACLRFAISSTNATMNLTDKNEIKIKDCSKDTSSSNSKY